MNVMLNDSLGPSTQRECLIPTRNCRVSSKLSRSNEPFGGTVQPSRWTSLPQGNTII